MNKKGSSHKIVKICPRCDRGMSDHPYHGVCGRCSQQIYKGRKLCLTKSTQTSTSQGQKRG